MKKVLELLIVVCLALSVLSSGCVSPPAPAATPIVTWTTAPTATEAPPSLVVVKRAETPVAKPTPGAPPRNARIGGRVWHDLCAVGGGQGRLPASPSAGCVAGDGGFRANGLSEANEPGIEGLSVTLGEGTCPSAGLAAAVTDVKGLYRFNDLDPGTYCVTVDPLQEPNASLLLPGGWTAPAVDHNHFTVTVRPGEERMDVDFGWDYQFLPAEQPQDKD